MMLGHIAHISLRMPFWLMILLGFVKPQSIIFVLGPPKRLADVESYKELSALENQERNFSKIVETEAGGIMLSCIFLISAILDVIYVYKSATIPGATWQERVREMLSSVAVSPNFGTTFSLIALVELYADPNDADPDRRPLGSMFTGEVWQVTRRIAFRAWEALVLDGRPCKFVLWILPQLVVLYVLQMAIGGFLQTIDEEAVWMMPSCVQRSLVRASFYSYKKLFHIMMVAALPGIIAYFWLIAILGAPLLTFGSSILVAVTPWVLKLRRHIGADERHIEAARKHVVSHQGAWLLYVLAPTCFALILPLMIPLALRLLGGVGYITALRETWEDRHFMVYSEALLVKSQHAKYSALSIAAQLWTNLLACFF